MIELELVRAAVDELAEPAEETVALAREVLRHEIVASADVGAKRPRARVKLAGMFALAAATVVVIAFVMTTGGTSFGVRIAAAAGEAVSPSGSELVHSISRTTVRITNRVGTTTSEQRDDSWWTTNPSTELDQTSYPTGTATQLTSACGVIVYDAKANLYTVSPATGPFNPIDDPVKAARAALRSGRVHYRGRVIYRGIPAAKLVVTQYGATTTYFVRRDNGYPLETILRRVTSHFTETVITRYSLFEHVARSTRTLQHVALTVHPNAFVVRTARAARTPPCSGFGSLEALQRRRAAQ